MANAKELLENGAAWRITDYVSHVFDASDKESEYQYLAEHPEEYYNTNPKDLVYELKNFYSENAFNYDHSRKLSERHAFLDYHLYKYIGEKIDFFEYVRLSPYRASHQDIYKRAHESFDRPFEKFISNWLESRKQEVERRRFPVDPADTRIMGELPVEVVEDYFMGVFTIASMKGKNGGKQIMTREEVSRFLGANFVGFPFYEIKDKIKTNAQQIYLKRAVYLFYEQHRFSKHDATSYCKALHETFDDFSQYATPRTLLSSFSTTADKKTESFLVSFLGNLLGK